MGLAFRDKVRALRPYPSFANARAIRVAFWGVSNVLGFRGVGWVRRFREGCGGEGNLARLLGAIFQLSLQPFYYSALPIAKATLHTAWI